MKGPTLPASPPLVIFAMTSPGLSTFCTTPSMVSLGTVAAATVYDSFLTSCVLRRYSLEPNGARCPPPLVKEGIASPWFVRVGQAGSGAGLLGLLELLELLPRVLGLDLVLRHPAVAV